MNKRARIIGTGMYVPEYILTNDKLSAMMDTSDEWITAHTGIRERRISTNEETWKMAALAGVKALENTGAEPMDIDFIIGCTNTSDYLFPAMACLVQAYLGADNATCFDVSAGCTTFVYALDMADQYIQTGRARNILIVCSDIISKCLDYTDRSSCILFGDGAGAVLVTAGDKGVIASYTRSQGAGGVVLSCPSKENNSPFFDKDAERSLHPAGDTTFMDGHAVYKFATRAMPEALEKALELAGVAPEQLRWCIPHQANLRIIKHAAKRIGIPDEKVYVNIDRYGNTSSATMPICLDELNRSGRLRDGDLIAIAGFGAGLTYGAAVLAW